MFDQLQIYKGTLVDAEPEAQTPTMETPMAEASGHDFDGQPDSQPTGQHSPSALIQMAEREAERIRMQAHTQAEELLEQTRSTAQAQADTMIAERVAQAQSALGTELWQSRYFLADILGDALETITGERAKPHMQLLAIEKAIMTRKSGARVTVRCQGHLADRLRLLAMGAGRGPVAPIIDIVEDPSVGPQSCILKTTDGQTEVGLDAQIAAFRRMAERASQKEN